ncbi:hypothetical protein BESB_011800 [Besnoitia besnoiti]|uniref:Uncharacterized protein n=1 Tax=Besnoitia besnoiti TaxID=94643 RepID=A0A2A9M244_BESBE|nr:hypothetical protein BESB_011800 [Besnoitia besnoiti]PFH32568.1 hypothetical protein BESB_011800 [Besnoitia besnoiti]
MTGSFHGLQSRPRLHRVSSGAQRPQCCRRQRRRGPARIRGRGADRRACRWSAAAPASAAWCTICCGTALQATASVGSLLPSAPQPRPLSARALSCSCALPPDPPRSPLQAPPAADPDEDDDLPLQSLTPRTSLRPFSRRSASPAPPRPARAAADCEAPPWPARGFHGAALHGAPLFDGFLGRSTGQPPAREETAPSARAPQRAFVAAAPFASPQRAPSLAAAAPSPSGAEPEGDARRPSQGGIGERGRQQAGAARDLGAQSQWSPAGASTSPATGREDGWACRQVRRHGHSRGGRAGGGDLLEARGDSCERRDDATGAAAAEKCSASEGEGKAARANEAQTGLWRSLYGRQHRRRAGESDARGGAAEPQRRGRGRWSLWAALAAEESGSDDEERSEASWSEFLEDEERRARGDAPRTETRTETRMAFEPLGAQEADGRGGCEERHSPEGGRGDPNGGTLSFVVQPLQPGKPSGRPVGGEGAPRPEDAGGCESAPRDREWIASRPPLPFLPPAAPPVWRAHASREAQMLLHWHHWLYWRALQGYAERPWSLGGPVPPIAARAPPEAGTARPPESVAGRERLAGAGRGGRAQAGPPARGESGEDSAEEELERLFFGEPRGRRRAARARERAERVEQAAHSKREVEAGSTGEAASREAPGLGQADMAAPQRLPVGSALGCLPQQPRDPSSFPSHRVPSLSSRPASDPACLYAPPLSAASSPPPGLSHVPSAGAPSSAAAEVYGRPGASAAPPLWQPYLPPPLPFFPAAAHSVHGAPPAAAAFCSQPPSARASPSPDASSSSFLLPHPLFGGVALPWVGPPGAAAPCTGAGLERHAAEGSGAAPPLGTRAQRPGSLTVVAARRASATAPGEGSAPQPSKPRESHRQAGSSFRSSLSSYLFPWPQRKAEGTRDAARPEALGASTPHGSKWGAEDAVGAGSAGAAPSPARSTTPSETSLAGAGCDGRTQAQGEGSSSSISSSSISSFSSRSLGFAERAAPSNGPEEGERRLQAEGVSRGRDEQRPKEAPIILPLPSWASTTEVPDAERGGERLSGSEDPTPRRGRKAPGDSEADRAESEQGDYVLWSPNACDKRLLRALEEAQADPHEALADAVASEAPRLHPPPAGSAPTGLPETGFSASCGLEKDALARLGLFPAFLFGGREAGRKAKGLAALPPVNVDVDVHISDAADEETTLAALPRRVASLLPPYAPQRLFAGRAAGERASPDAPRDEASCVSTLQGDEDDVFVIAGAPETDGGLASGSLNAFLGGATATAARSAARLLTGAACQEAEVTEPRRSRHAEDSRERGARGAAESDARLRSPWARARPPRSGTEAASRATASAIRGDMSSPRAREDFAASVPETTGDSRRGGASERPTEAACSLEAEALNGRPGLDSVSALSEEAEGEVASDDAAQMRSDARQVPSPRFSSSLSPAACHSPFPFVYERQQMPRAQRASSLPRCLSPPHSPSPLGADADSALPRRVPCPPRGSRASSRSASPSRRAFFSAEAASGAGSLVLDSQMPPCASLLSLAAFAAPPRARAEAEARVTGGRRAGHARSEPDAERRDDWEGERSRRRGEPAKEEESAAEQQAKETERETDTETDTEREGEEPRDAGETTAAESDSGVLDTNAWRAGDCAAVRPSPQGMRAEIQRREKTRHDDCCRLRAAEETGRAQRHGGEDACEAACAPLSPPRSPSRASVSSAASLPWVDVMHAARSRALAAASAVRRAAEDAAKKSFALSSSAFMSSSASAGLFRKRSEKLFQRASGGSVNSAEVEEVARRILSDGDAFEVRRRSPARCCTEAAASSGGACVSFASGGSDFHNSSMRREETAGDARGVFRRSSPAQSAALPAFGSGFLGAGREGDKQRTRAKQMQDARRTALHDKQFLLMLQQQVLCEDAQIAVAAAAAAAHPEDRGSCREGPRGGRGGEGEAVDAERRDDCRDTAAKKDGGESSTGGRQGADAGGDEPTPRL